MSLARWFQSRSERGSRRRRLAFSGMAAEILEARSLMTTGLPAAPVLVSPGGSATPT